MLVTSIAHSEGQILSLGGHFRLKVLGVAFLFWNLPWFWNGYWLLFGVLVFLSFVPEWVGKTYLPVAIGVIRLPNACLVAAGQR